MKILTFSGKAEAGKDTSALFFKEEMEKLGKKSLIIHNADFLKFVCKQYFGWNGEKDEIGRTLLQQVGTEVVRIKKNQPNFWVDTVGYFISVFKDDYDYFLIPDCRYENEVLVLENDFDYNVYAINVMRPYHSNSLTYEQRQHPSETSMDYFDFDYIITNYEGLDNLKSAVHDLVQWVLEEEKEE